MDRPLLTRKELAARLKISTRTFDRLNTAGDILLPLPGLRGLNRWDPEEVNDWIGAGCPNARSWASERRRRGYR